jgi:DNA-binding GntR family transcriptional regulator
MTVAREHREIVQSLARGDAKGAGRLLRRHSEVLAGFATADKQPSMAVATTGR